jgi:hypothetical protein
MGEIIFDLRYSSESCSRLTGPLSGALADWLAATHPKLAGHLAKNPEEKSVIAVHVACTGLEAEGSSVWCLFLLHLDSVDFVDAPAIARGVLFVGGETWIQTRLADVRAQLNEQLQAPGTKATIACS